MPPASASTVARIGLMAAVTAVGAYLKIPLPMLPVTLQMTFVGLAGFWLGPWHGAASQLTYLCVGLVGVPVFAKGGGPQYVFEPTFGYLLGFSPSAFVTGFIAQRITSYPGAVAAVFAGVAVVYAIGVPYFLLIVTLALDGEQPPHALAGLLLTPLPKDLIVGLATAYLAWRTRASFARFSNVDRA